MTRQVFVRKSDKMEKFNDDKIINSLLNVGLQASLAVSIATEIFEEIKNNVSDHEIEISSKEIRAKVYEKLKNTDNNLADKYLKGNTTKVRTSLSTFEDFDANKITRSLIEETDIDEKIAERISKNVKKQMGKLNLEFVTAPLIREMVCVELLKNGFEKERKLYTRLGMPVYDVTFLIEHGSKENANLQFNPESLPYDEKVLVGINGKIRSEKIGKIVEDVISKYENKKTISQNGRSEIVETDAGISVFSFDENFKVREFPVKAFIKNKPDEIFEVKFSHGKSVRITKNHNLFFLINGSVTSVPLSEFKICDKILVPRKIERAKIQKFINGYENLVKSEFINDKEILLFGRPIDRFIEKNNMNPIKKFGKNCLTLKTLKELKFEPEEEEIKDLSCITHNSFKTTPPLRVYYEMNEDLGAWFGLMLSEGHFGTTLFFSNKDKSLHEKFKRCTKSVFKGMSLRESKKNKGCYNTILGSTATAKIIPAIFDVIDGNEKKIPDYMFNAPLSFIKEFIKAYHEGDGEKGRMRITTTNEDIKGILTYFFLVLGEVVGSCEREFKNPKWKKAYDIEIANGKSSLDVSKSLGIPINKYEKKSNGYEYMCGDIVKQTVELIGNQTNQVNTDIYKFRNISNIITENILRRFIEKANIILKNNRTFVLLEMFGESEIKRQDVSKISGLNGTAAKEYLKRLCERGMAIEKESYFSKIKFETHAIKKFKKIKENLALLEKILNSDIALVSIKSIKKAGFEPTYDMSIDSETENFIAGNGCVFVHNTIHKLMADQISKEYSLIKVLPLDLADAHMNGEIHIHDLDYFALRPFCFSHDIRFFLKHGLKVDGVGNHTAVAGPSKKPDVAFLHAAKVLASAQVNCAGGQGFSYFNTFLAPYVSGLPYEKVKQLAQMFIYEMSMMYVARGGQSVGEHEYIWTIQKDSLTYSTIGAFVDELLKKERDNVEEGWDKEVLRIEKKGVKTYGLDLDTGKFGEFTITAVSRHVPTEDKLYEIKTKRGNSVRVTNYHSIYTYIDKKIKKVRASNLKVGDSVIVPKNRKEYTNSDFSFDKIVSINKVPATEYVYDLEVAPNGKHIENFLCEGILVSNTVFSSIDCDMEVPEQFKNIPAVLPGGIVKENTTYGDFEDEVKTLFNAFIDVYLQGDWTGKAFNFPKFEVQIYPKKIDKNEDMLLKVSQLAAKFGTPYYIINQPYMPLYACYQSLPYDEKVWIIKGEELHLVRIGEYVNRLMDKEMKEKGHINLGRGFEGEVEIAESQDYVISFNPKTLKIEKKKIGKVMRHPKREMIYRFHLTFRRSITVTAKHKLLIERNGKIIEERAENIKFGDRLIGIRNMGGAIKDMNLTIVEEENKNTDVRYHEVDASWYTNMEGSNVTLKPERDETVSLYRTLDRFGYDFAFSNLSVYEVRTIEQVIGSPYVYDFADVEDYHNFVNIYGIFSSNCCSFLMPLTDANTEDDVRDGTIRGGGLQVVTINLPQIAYESNRSEEKFNEILKDRMEKAKKVHLLKREIIKKNQNLGMLPFMSQIVNEKGDKYLEVDRQSFIMGLIGMNECVKFMTDCELHEDAGWKFGLKIMNAMKGIVADIRKETGLTFSLARTPAESCSYRLAQIDSRRFQDKFIANGNGKDAYYTNSFHVRPSANIPLWKRLSVEGAFHPLTDGGAMSHVWLGEQNPDPEGILSLTKKIATKTAIQYMAFTKDLTVCSNCNFVTGGLHDKCPGCNSENVEWWSRITGYYQNIKGWNKGKLKELQDRRRYGFENNDKITAKEISFTMKEGDYEAKFEKLKEKLKYDTSMDF